MEWREPPASISPPAADGVDLWLAQFEELSHPGDVLSPDERERANRFKAPRPLEQFLKARGFLRTILGGYLRISPRDVRFRYQARGKPELAGPAIDLRFNLAHTDGLVLLGISLGREIGVDVEVLDESRECEGLAARYFSSAETAEFFAVPSHDRTRAFFNGWTRKEAYIKARGEGLHLALDSFTVRLAPGASAQLLESQSDAREVARWAMFDLDVGAKHAAAAVVERPVADLRLNRWPPGHRGASAL
jgi:4'-phosphopantetheinyl transferase